MLVALADAVTFGTAFTVIVTVALFVQPLLVPVTEYVVVDVGETVYVALVPSE